MEIRLTESTESETGVALTPSSAEVIEEANGDYALVMTHAADPVHGRHLLVQCGKVLWARVPGKNLPLRHIEKTRGPVPVYRVIGAAVQVKRGTPEGEVTVTERRAVPLWQNRERTRRLGRLLPGERVTGLPGGAETEAARPVLTGSGERGWAETGYLRADGMTEGDVETLCEEQAKSGQTACFRIARVEKEKGEAVRVIAPHVYYDCDEHEAAPGVWQEVPLSEALDGLSRENGQITLLTDREVRVNGSYGGACSKIVERLCGELDLQLVREGKTAYLLAAGNTERRFRVDAARMKGDYRLQEDAREVTDCFIPWVNGEAGTPVRREGEGKHTRGRTVYVQADSEEKARAEAERRLQAGADESKTTLRWTCGGR